MKSSTFAFLSILLLCVVSLSASIPIRFNPVGNTVLHGLSSPDSVSDSLPDHFQTHYFTQTLDHFNYNPESYDTFIQRYFIDSRYWDGPNSTAPIFVYLGAESELDPRAIGFLEENAPSFKALSVFIEHRFYGQSNPLGSMEAVLNNKKVRGYFNSVQALADYAKIIMHLKTTLSAQHSPVIVIGGSYGGMLATWFRLKYPHIALGALASSAPIFNFDGLAPADAYFSGVTKDFKNESQNCYKTIRESWTEIDRIASMPNGLAILSMKFKTCRPLNDASVLKDYLKSNYAHAAQYENPLDSQVTKICKAIDGAPDETSIIDKIAAGLVSNYQGYDNVCFDIARNPTADLYFGWTWQRCTDMVTPMGVTDEDSMYPKDPFSLANFIDDCKAKYDIAPRPHWATTYYGGQDIKLVLKKFGSNIIFSNGLRDPFSGSGVLEDISDSLLAIYTDKGSHCLDIVPSMEGDPVWLVNQRKREVDIIRGWITKYNQDFRDSQK